MKIRHYLGILLVTFMCTFAVLQAVPAVSYAAPAEGPYSEEANTGPSDDACANGNKGRFLGFPTWYQYLKSETIAGKCNPVVNDASDAIPILVAVTEMLLRLIGVISVAYVVYGSIRYILSQGQPDATKNARTTIINAIVGVVISLTAASAVSYFANRLTTPAEPTSYNTVSTQRIQA